MQTVPRLRPALKRTAPGLSHERAHWAHDRVVVGIDEVGRGAWAGPLTVGAVVVPSDRRVYKIRDSKMLTEEEREMLCGRITDWAAAWAVGHASEVECDELGMSDAQRLATSRALDRLGIGVDRVLVDGNWDFVGTGNVTTIVRGDRTSLSIAAASIVAKVTRDRILRAASPSYPMYGFETNKGYPCPTHKAALHAWGPSSIHRRSWAFMDGLAWSGVPRFERPEAQLRLAI
ncbi:MAG TPA: ribonuclease HII [Acidimicrobiia bacterium]|nr:ribonuclease HII [Acidimicrobiia bacterium]